MAFKLKHKDLNNQDFTRALGKLCNTAGLPVKLAYTVGKTQKAIQKEMQEARVGFQKLIDQFAEKDEHGKRVEPEGEGSYKIADEKMKDFDQAVQDFMDIELEISQSKVTLDQLERANLTPNEIMALEPLLNTLEVIDQSAAG